tara:strand:- start:1639 stop:2625 length:987 start_codon:yes stop_codon:yes gene_type:complete
MIYKSFLVENNINVLKNKLILFYGENLGLINEFKKKIIDQNKHTHILRFTQEEILKNEDNFLSELYNTSLFKNQKIFFVYDANDKISKLITNILPNIGENKIFLFSDVLEKKSKLRNFFEKEKTTDIIPCYTDNEISIKKIISNSLKEFRGVSQQILNIIYKSCNNDRMKLYNEIDKIKAYFSEKFINDKDLIELLNVSENENFNYIKDSTLNGNRKKTNELLNNTILEREKSIFYISTINKRLENLKIVSQKKDVNIEKAVTELRPPIFWKDKPNFIQQARLWNVNKINVALKKTYDVELKIKSNSNLDNKIVMKKLLVDICLLANA